jgi:hypothetical protein
VLLAATLDVFSFFAGFILKLIRNGLRQDTLQRQNTEISKQIFPEKEYRGLGPNFHIHVSVSDLYMYFHYWSAYSAGGNM